MDADALKEYLGIVLDMEKNILLRAHLIEGLTANVGQLGIPRTLTALAKPPKYVPPTKPRVIYEDDDGESPMYSFSGFVIFGKYVLIATVVILGLIGGSLSDGMTIFLFFLPFVFLALVMIYGRSKEKEAKREASRQKMEQQEAEWKQRKKSARRAWEVSMADYNSAVCAYQQSILEDRRRVLSENERKRFLQQTIDGLIQKQEESKQLLDRIYAKNVVFPKYRNLVAVASLYEYICAGRCAALDGYEGAYNIYETEVRMDRVITQLDQVIEHLVAIRNNQFVLFTAVQEINQQCAGILRSVQDIDQKSMLILETARDASDNIALQIGSITGQADQISGQLQELQKTSALAAYNAERSQKELAYMNRMDYLSGKNDDVFWNHPPVQ